VVLAWHSQRAKTEQEKEYQSEPPMALKPKPESHMRFLFLRQDSGLRRLEGVWTYLDEMVEEHGSHGGQGEPDEDGEGRDAGHVQGVEQVRGHDGSSLAE